MIKSILAISAALVLVSFPALAAGPKKPVTCQNFSVAKLDSGATIGLCMGKPGKKPRILSTYTITTVKNPEGADVKVMVGF
jgi:hypothetical protein